MINLYKTICIERFPFIEEARSHQWNYERILDTEPETNDCHPSLKGHEQLAEHIIKAIAKKENYFTQTIATKYLYR